MKFTISTYIFLLILSSTKLVYAGIDNPGSTVRFVSYSKTQFTPQKEEEILKNISSLKDEKSKFGSMESLKKKKEKEEEKENKTDNYKFFGFVNCHLHSDPHNLLDPKSVTKVNLPILDPGLFGVVNLLACIFKCPGKQLIAEHIIENPANEKQTPEKSDLLGAVNYSKLERLLNIDLKSEGTKLDSFLVKIDGTLKSLGEEIISNDPRLKTEGKFITKCELVSIVNHQLATNRHSKASAAKAINQACEGKSMIIDKNALLNNPADEKASIKFETDTFNQDNINQDKINELFGKTDTKKMSK